MAKKKARKKPVNSKAPGRRVAKKVAAPRQKALPGMEEQDRAIIALENAALAYDEVKRERMGLTVQEVDAKKKVQSLMHAKGKTHYKRGNITIDLVPEGEKVRVRVSAEEMPANAPAETSADPQPEVPTAEEQREEDLEEELEREEEEEEGDEVPELGV